MLFNLVILDDNLQDLDTIYDMTCDFFMSKSINISIHKYNDIHDFPMNRNYDVLFLDIDMPDQSGFDIARQYKKLYKNAIIIFITNHNELVYKACNIHPFDFIRKENIKLEIPMVLEEVLYKLTDLYPTCIFYINGNAYVIKKDSILYCESFNHSTEIHFEQSSIIVNQQLKDIEKTINSIHFKRIGRSYLVNMTKVKKIQDTSLFMEYNHEIPISRRKKKMIIELFEEVHHHANRN